MLLRSVQQKAGKTKESPEFSSDGPELPLLLVASLLLGMVTSGAICCAVGLIKHLGGEVSTDSLSKFCIGYAACRRTHEHRCLMFFVSLCL